MDNRNKTKSAALEEIENDESPIDEGENPKDDPEADGHIDNPEDKENPENKEDAIEEDILTEDEEIDEETGEIKKKPVVTPPAKQNLPDAEERLAEQRREATILNERNKQLTEAFSRVDEVKDPTEDELKAATRQEGFEWDDMSNFERSMFKKNFINDQKLSIVNTAVKGVKDIDGWAKNVDKYLDDNERDQTNKSLIGHEGAFRAFAMKQTHRGVDMGILVSAFLHDAPQVKKNNGSIMLTRAGGKPQEKKNNLMDAEYVSALRKNQPKEYQRLLRAGKINIEI